MDKIIKTLADVWPTIRTLPPGKHVIQGSPKVLSFVRQAVEQYGPIQAEATEYAEPAKPILVTDAYRENNTLIPGAITVHVKPHTWVPFTPNMPVVAIARDMAAQLIATGEPQIIPCNASQVASVRNYFSGHDPAVRVIAVPVGAEISLKAVSDEPSIYNEIKDKVHRISDGSAIESVQLDDRKTPAYVRGLVSKWATRLGLKVKVTVADGVATITPRASNISMDVGRAMDGLLSRGHSISDILAEIQRFMGEPGPDQHDPDEII